MCKKYKHNNEHKCKGEKYKEKNERKREGGRKVIVILQLQLCNKINPCHIVVIVSRKNSVD